MYRRVAFHVVAASSSSSLALCSSSRFQTGGGDGFTSNSGSTGAPRAASMSRRRRVVPSEFDDEEHAGLRAADEQLDDLPRKPFVEPIAPISGRWKRNATAAEADAEIDVEEDEVEDRHLDTKRTRRTSPQTQGVPKPRSLRSAEDDFDAADDNIVRQEEEEPEQSTVAGSKSRWGSSAARRPPAAKRGWGIKDDSVIADAEDDDAMQDGAAAASHRRATAWGNNTASAHREEGTPTPSRSTAAIDPMLQQEEEYDHEDADVAIPARTHSARRADAAVNDLQEEDDVASGELSEDASTRTTSTSSKPKEPTLVAAEPNSDEVEYVSEYSPFVDPATNELVTIPIQELVDRICLYQRATENPRVVSHDIEAHMYPVLLQRLEECSAEQLLDIVESPWARSTLVRHGILLKDKIRDRIAAIVTDLSPEVLLRALIVVGMSAGRRKRDVDFFRLLGRLVVVHINSYKDPNDLQKVLTAFARAKIIPPPSFLALLGRRFAVLSKKIPLRGLPTYRAFINLRRMGYDQMNAFRFLADRLYEIIEENIRQEKVALRTKELLAERRAAMAQDGALNEAKADGTAAETAVTGNSERQAAPAEQLEEVLTLSEAAAARRRFEAITEIRPAMLTKLLLVLARLKAPHQQYLRPLIKPVLVPCLPYFPPPTFSRLIKTLRIFRTPDRDLLEPVVDRMVREGVEDVNVSDVLETLRILSHVDTPMIRNFSEFIQLCEKVFGVQARLRPNEMCAIASDLMMVQRKEDTPLSAVEPLVSLMDVFAERLIELMDLGVLPLTQAEIFEELCEQMHHPDAKGNVARLKAARRTVNKAEGGDDDYYMRLDIDIRELFQKCVIVNNWNTHNDYRPVPGVVQVDFKQALAEVSLETVIATAGLFERAYPGRMRPTLRRYLSRSALAKMSDAGEEFVTAENVIELRPTEDAKLFDRPSLETFVNQLLVSPLSTVRNSLEAWTFVKKVGESLKSKVAVEIATKQLTKLATAEAMGRGRSSAEGTEGDEPSSMEETYGAAAAASAP